MRNDNPPTHSGWETYLSDYFIIPLFNMVFLTEGEVIVTGYSRDHVIRAMPSMH